MFFPRRDGSRVQRGTVCPLLIAFANVSRQFRLLRGSTTPATATIDNFWDEDPRQDRSDFKMRHDRSPDVPRLITQPRPLEV